MDTGEIERILQESKRLKRRSDELINAIIDWGKTEKFDPRDDRGARRRSRARMRALARRLEKERDERIREN
jgi:hypothetical protein